MGLWAIFFEFHLKTVIKWLFELIINIDDVCSKLYEIGPPCMEIIPLTRHLSSYLHNVCLPLLDVCPLLYEVSPPLHDVCPPLEYVSLLKIKNVHVKIFLVIFLLGGGYYLPWCVCLVEYLTTEKNTKHWTVPEIYATATAISK